MRMGKDCRSCRVEGAADGRCAEGKLLFYDAGGGEGGRSRSHNTRPRPSLRPPLARECASEACCTLSPKARAVPMPLSLSPNIYAHCNPPSGPRSLPPAPLEAVHGQPAPPWQLASAPFSAGAFKMPPITHLPPANAPTYNQSVGTFGVPHHVPLHVSISQARPDFGGFGTGLRGR